MQATENNQTSLHEANIALSSALEASVQVNQKLLDWGVELEALTDSLRVAYPGVGPALRGMLDVYYDIREELEQAVVDQLAEADSALQHVAVDE